MHEMYDNELVKNNPELKAKIHDLIEKHYPHLRHSLRGEIEVDAFLIDELFTIMDGFLNERL